MTEYVMVPREPTQEMLEAGDTAFENGYVSEMWSAMIAAAPQQQTLCVGCQQPDYCRASGCVMQPQQAEPAPSDLEIRAVEELMQLGYTVKGNQLYPPQHAEPVAWMDDFGNVFPLAANKGAGHWLDDHKRNWKPLYAFPQPRITAEQVAEIKRLADQRSFTVNTQDSNEPVAWADFYADTHEPCDMGEVIWQRDMPTPRPEPGDDWYWRPLYLAPRITAEQAAKIKRLAKELESAAFLYGESITEQSHVNLVTASDALHAALDALVKGE